MTPRRRLADALRTAVGLAAVGDFDDAAAARAAALVEDLNASLAAAARHAAPPPFTAAGFFDGEFRTTTSPVTGVCNPLAPPLHIGNVDGAAGAPREVAGQVSFGKAYEGVPNCVHGGVIAQTLDELLGASNQAAGTVGMTVQMTVRYRKPTPAGVPLRLEARCTRRDGRKLHSWAAIRHGEDITAEAEGVFIEVTPQQFEAIARACTPQAGTPGAA